jgi:hypothetical protein
MCLATRDRARTCQGSGTLCIPSQSTMDYGPEYDV